VALGQVLLDKWQVSLVQSLDPSNKLVWIFHSKFNGSIEKEEQPYQPAGSVHKIKSGY